MLLTLAHSPSLLGAAPGWVYATNAVLILSYQTLDGSDGKQARRTSSGSPIGELFDHGVDAWATGCIVFICIDAFAFGIQSPWPWLVLVGAQLAFFASNLTLLQTGRMQVDDMGVIELQSVMSICLCATAMYSPSIWQMHAPSIFGHIFEVRQLLAVGIIFNITKAVVGSVYNAFCHALDHGRTSSSSSSARNGHADVSSSARRASNGYMGLVQHCGIVATYAGCVGASYACLRRHGTGDIPMRLLWLCANSCFAEYLTRLLVERVTSRRLPALAPSLLWIMGFLGASLQPANLIACALAASSAAVAHAGYFVWACSPRNTPIIKAIEVRLIEKRCRALYSTPDAGDGAGERQRAFAVLQQLQMVRSQKAKARIPEPTWRAEPTVYTSGSSAELNTRMLAERASMRFEEKDRDGDLTLDFEEFHANFPRLVREAVGVEGIRRWFDEADTDGDKTLTKNEFFAWCMKHGQGGLHDKFAKFDRLQTGSLDYNEFERLCASVGFGGEARKIFPSLDEERRGVIKLEGIEELVKRHSENRRLSARAKEMLCMVLLAGAEAALSAEGASDLRSKTKDWAIRARDAAGVRVELHALLSGSGAAIVDVMALFNSDREQLIDEMEFQTTLKTLFKCHAKPWELDAVFESIDLDRSGSIGFDELFEFVRGRRHAHDRRSLVVRRLSLQPPPGAAWALGDIEWDVETFRSLLRQNFKVHDVKVADVIKAWDRSGDGQLSESEYLHHMELFFMSSSAAASMALRQLWQQEVRSVALSAFHVVAAIDRNGREEGANDEEEERHARRAPAE